MCRCRLCNGTVSDAASVSKLVDKGFKVALRRVDEERRWVTQGGLTTSSTSRAAKPFPFQEVSTRCHPALARQKDMYKIDQLLGPMFRFHGVVLQSKDM